LGKVKSWRSYEKTISLGILAIMIGGGFINMTRPQNFIVQVIITGMSIFIIYLVIPNRFLHQFLISSTTTIGEALIIVLVLRPEGVSSLFTIFLSLGFANVVGALSSWQLHSYRNNSYQDFVKRNELQETLEKYTKHLEDVVAERTEKLKASERLAAIGATAGMVGHDIRNPLTAITGAVYIAKNKLKQVPEGDAKESLKNNLDFIADQTVYVNKIVEDLQDYARPLQPKLEETSIDQIVQSTISELRIPAGVTVTYLIEKNYPKLKTDSLYVKRILTNLTNNAVQAMPNGGKLTITVSSENGKAQISVEDTGEGIPQEAKDRLFTPLVTTKSKGQGFGLAVVKRLTEALNGTITYESEVGKGTKFTIELPQ
jgi:signal transduction histidine kinase